MNETADRGFPASTPGSAEFGNVLSNYNPDCERDEA